MREKGRRRRRRRRRKGTRKSYDATKRKEKERVCWHVWQHGAFFSAFSFSFHFPTEGTKNERNEKGNKQEKQKLGLGTSQGQVRKEHLGVRLPRPGPRWPRPGLASLSFFALSFLFLSFSAPTGGTPDLQANRELDPSSCCPLVLFPPVLLSSCPVVFLSFRTPIVTVPPSSFLPLIMWMHKLAMAQLPKGKERSASNDYKVRRKAHRNSGTDTVHTTNSHGLCIDE